MERGKFRAYIRHLPDGEDPWQATVYLGEKGKTNDVTISRHASLSLAQAACETAARKYYMALQAERAEWPEPADEPTT